MTLKVLPLSVWSALSCILLEKTLVLKESITILKIVWSIVRLLTGVWLVLRVLSRH